MLGDTSTGFLDIFSFQIDKWTKAKSERRGEPTEVAMNLRRSRWKLSGRLGGPAQIPPLLPFPAKADKSGRCPNTVLEHVGMVEVTV